MSFFMEAAIETLTSPDALDKIVPVLAGKIGEALTTLIEDEIKKCLETHVGREYCS
jgi:ABC-type microcin C transport system permease subunit YejE